MIRDICKDEEFLKIPSTDADIDDIEIVMDLVETYIAHQNDCLGMAANMIGFSKNVIVVNLHDELTVMLNPVITEAKKEYETEEGCLSLEGLRKTKRYKNITVEYTDIKFKKRRMKLSGLSAQIVQHEIDHLKGIII